MPTIIKVFAEAIKPWDKDAVIEISIEEAPFGIAFVKRDITQLCNMEEIGATTVTLCIR